MQVKMKLIIPDVVLIQLSTWGWAHSCSKYVEDSNKHIIEEIVRQVGYLPKFYEDTRSEKYKSFLKIWKGIFIYFRISFIPQIVKANILKPVIFSATKFKPV
jgi:hypothetical protein